MCVCAVGGVKGGGERCCVGHIESHLMDHTHKLVEQPVSAGQKQTNKQTTNKRTSKEASKQADKQTNQRTSKEANEAHQEIVERAHVCERECVFAFVFFEKQHATLVMCCFLELGLPKLWLEEAVNGLSTKFQQHAEWYKRGKQSKQHKSKAGKVRRNKTPEAVNQHGVCAFSLCATQHALTCIGPQKLALSASDEERS